MKQEEPKAKKFSKITHELKITINIAVQQFLVRRHRRRRFQLRYLQDFSTFYLHLRVKSELACRQRKTWVFPRPHNWLQQLLNNDALDHWWE